MPNHTEITIPKNLSEPDFGPMGKDVYDRSYSRIKPNGSREIWAETIRRVVEGNINRVSEKYIEPWEGVKLYHLLYGMKALPAGRFLWASGTSKDECVVNCFCVHYDLDDFSRHFCYLFARLLEGGGVGASYSNRHIRDFDVIPKEIDVHIVCDANHDDYEDLEPLLSEKYSPDYWGNIEVADSREGWVEALQILLRAYYNGEESPLVFDVSQIRPKGARLKSFGGVASGPFALAKLLHRASHIMNQSVGEKPNSFLYMNLDHEISKAVVAGGNRRSARISTKHWNDRDIFEFIHCKDDSEAHWSTNISVEVDREFWEALREGEEKATRVWEEGARGALIHGEPGFINMNRMMEDEVTIPVSTNPCLSGDTLIATADGRNYVPIKDLAEAGKDVPVYTVNTDTQEVEIKLGVHPRKTGCNKPVYKITFDDGSSLRTTGDHKFPLKAGGEKRTRELSKGDILFGFSKYQYPNPDRKYWLVRGSRGVELREHQIIAEYHEKRPSPHHIIHHKDGDSLNNSPRNLEWVEKGKHNSLHNKSYSGIQNGNSIGLSNKRLLEIGAIRTASLGRRMTQKEFCTLFGVSIAFFASKYRKERFGSLAEFLDECVNKAKVPKCPEDVDHRTWRCHIESDLKTEIGEKGYLWVVKNCEWCGKEFYAAWSKREQGFCSHKCGYKAHGDQQRGQRKATREEMLRSGFEFFQIHEKLPTVKEWDSFDRSVCSREPIRQVFGSWSNFKEEVEHYCHYPNHKVVSVEFCGYEDVYNITTEDNHTVACVTNPDDKSRSGHKKLSGIYLRQCGELVLAPQTGCILGNINLNKFHNDIPGAREAFRLMARFLLRATFADFADDELKRNMRRERKIGVGFFGFHDFLIRNGCRYSDFPHDTTMKGLFAEFYEEVRKAAREYAFQLRIPEPTTVTCCPPCGSTSQLSGDTPGIHPHIFAPYYIRRVRFSTLDEGKRAALKRYEAQGYTVEDDLYSPNTKVVEFPMRVGILNHRVDMELIEDTTDLTIEDFLEVQKALQEVYADSGISATVNLGSETDLERVKSAIRVYLPDLKGVTFMPHVSGRKQMPFEPISKEQYDQYPEELKDVGVIDKSCPGGACEFDPSNVKVE